MPTLDRKRLLDTLDRALSAEDVASLVFDLGLDPANVEGTIKRARLRSLIEIYERQGQMDRLIAAVNALRPDVLAPDTVYAAPVIDSPPVSAPRAPRVSPRWLLAGLVVALGLAAALWGVTRLSGSAPSDAVNLARLNQTLASEPDNALALFDRAGIYLNQGDYRRAIDDYTRVTALRPGYAAAYYYLAICYEKVGDYPNALDSYTHAIEDQAEPVYLLDRGALYADQGDLDSAINDFSEAIRLKSDYAAALYARGVAYRRQKENDKAIADFTAVVDLDSEWRSDAEAQLKALNAP